MKIEQIYLIYAVSLLMILVSCNKSQHFTLSSDIDDTTIPHIILSNPIENIQDTIELPLIGSQAINLPNKEMVLSIRAGKLRSTVFVKPNIALNISIGENKSEIKITSDQVKEQSLLDDLEREINIANTKYGPYKIMNIGLDSFHIKLEEKYTKVDNLIAESSGHVSSNLLSWIENRVKAGKVMAKIDYPSYFAHLTGNKAELGADYFDFIGDFDFEDADKFCFDDVRYAGERVIAHDIDFNKLEGPYDYYLTQYENVEKYTSNIELQDFYKYKIISDKLEYAGGSDGIEDLIADYLSITSSASRKKDLEKSISHWSHLKSGLEAPNFTAFTRAGESVQLEELKGKNVYIDVWATWCGPCIAEIPSLQTIEEQYHDENIEFVSVSIDNKKDEEKWKKFVEERNLGGTQLMAENAWQSDLAQQYNIKSIPRFLVIDKDGKIVSADAPRPSDKKQIENMFSELLD